MATKKKKGYVREFGDYLKTEIPKFVKQVNREGRKTFKAWLVLNGTEVLEWNRSRRHSRKAAGDWRTLGKRAARARRVLITEIGRA